MSDKKATGRSLLRILTGHMTCDSCGRETTINYGGADGIACSYCCGSEKPSSSAGVDDSTFHVPVERKSLKEFSEYYLTQLKSNLENFGEFASVLKVLFLLQALISVAMAIYVFTISGLWGVIQIALFAVSFSLLSWLAYLGKQFIKLQLEKVENDIHTTLEYRSETINMGKQLLEKVEKKAQQSITMNGGNAVFAFNGSTVSGVTQTITVEGNSELVEALAMLVSFCEASGQEKAFKMATQMAEEAAKEAPDKGILFDLWAGITSALPQVTGIVKIAQGIKSLFV